MQRYRTFLPILSGFALLFAVETANAAPPKNKRVAKVQVETIPLPVEPREQICQSLIPAANVNGEIVQFNVQYCGYISYDPEDGRRYIYPKYMSLMTQQKVAVSIWPTPETTDVAYKYISDIKEKVSSISYASVQAFCSDASADSKFLCGLYRMSNGEYEQAISDFDDAIKLGDVEGSSLPMAVSIILKSAESTSSYDWIQRRNLVRTLLRVDPSGAVSSELLYMDGKLKD